MVLPCPRLLLGMVLTNLLLLRSTLRMKLRFASVSSSLGKSLILSLSLRSLVALLIKPLRLLATNPQLKWSVSYSSLAFPLLLLSSAILANFDSRQISGPQYLLDVLGPTDNHRSWTRSPGPQAVKVAPPAPK